MKKSIIFSSIALALAAVSCSEDVRFDSSEGEGRVLLRPSLNSDVKVVSRSIQSDAELAENAIIWISSPKGVVRKYSGVDNVPASGIALACDNYVAEVWAGDSVSASFDHRYFKGREEFKIEAGSTVQVDVECHIANSVVEVAYDDAIDDVLTDYSLTVSHKRGSLTYTGRDDENRSGYFMMPSYDKDLVCILTGTKPDGTILTYGKVIENAKPSTLYRLTVKHGGPVEEEIGGALISIVVDETSITEVDDPFEVYSAPTIEGTNFDITKTVMGQEGTLTEKKLWIKTTSAFKKIEVRGDKFGEFFGIGGDDFEILGMQDEIRSALLANGFSYQQFTHDDSDCQEMKLIFNETLLNRYTNGEYSIDVTVVDSNNKTTKATINIVLSDAKTRTEETVPGDVWATSATLQGTIMKAGQTGMAFIWREKGASQWNNVALADYDNAEEGTVVAAEITGLKPATEYEYKFVCDGFDTSDIRSFTTESAIQLANASFETWNTSDKAYLPAADASSMFWDSGNHGSATMSKNITTPSTDYVHSGSYSAKLESQFVGLGSIGKFAAGNIFIGQYLATQGTDGVLGWGRPFTSRPKALRGYVKYTPQAATHASDGAGISKGDMDQGIIYIAIVDNTTQTYNNQSWPVIIKTKTSERQLFDPKGSNVIGYGEKVFTEATPGNGLIEFEIPIEYFKTDVKACNIILTCSASRYGDYFTGGPSVMYIDDFELVY